MTKRVYLSQSALAPRGVCAEGVALFGKLYGTRTIVTVAKARTVATKVGWNGWLWLRVLLNSAGKDAVTIAKREALDRYNAAIAKGGSVRTLATAATNRDKAIAAAWAQAFLDQAR